jgi:homoserine kinase
MQMAKNSAAKRSARASAPATVANVSCGFDVFGFAVASPEDEVEIELTTLTEVKIESITGDGGLLPLDATKNTAGVAVQKFLAHTGWQTGASIRLNKKLPLGSGMGSSAASAVAAVLAINALHPTPLPRTELLPFALEAERIACGAAHADNAAPSLLGGFTLIRSYDPLDVIQISCPANLYCVLVHPHIEVKTKDARLVMKTSVPIRDAITQWGNTAGLVAGLLKNDFELIGRSLQDVVAEPVRSMLIPGFYDIQQQARMAGALGCGISGSGPSLFALTEGIDRAHAVGETIQRAFQKTGLASDVYISGINTTGGRVYDVV